MFIAEVTFTKAIAPPLLLALFLTIIFFLKKTVVEDSIYAAPPLFPATFSAIEFVLKVHTTVFPFKYSPPPLKDALFS